MSNMDISSMLLLVSIAHAFQETTDPMALRRDWPLFWQVESWESHGVSCSVATKPATLYCGSREKLRGIESMVSQFHIPLNTTSIYDML